MHRASGGISERTTIFYADGADYLEINKGAMELLGVMEIIGINKFPECLTTWIRTSSRNNPVFRDFYGELSKLYTAKGRKGLADVFETVRQ